MADSRPAKRTLSDRLAGMGFMRRRAERDKRETHVKRQRVREAAAHWTAPTPTAEGTLASETPGTEAERQLPIVIVENGYGDDDEQEIVLGRQSFGSFNVGLERRNAARLADVDPFTERPVEMKAQASGDNLAELRQRNANPALAQNAPEFILPEIAPAPVADTTPPPAPKSRKGSKLAASPAISKPKGKEGSRRSKQK